LELAIEQQIPARGIVSKYHDVQDVHAFGDYLHLRVRSAEEPLSRNPAELAESYIAIQHFKPVPATLEGVAWDLAAGPFLDAVENLIK
jgi:hypothetical protein